VITKSAIVLIGALAGASLSAQGPSRPVPPPYQPSGGSALDIPFVRNQALLGALVYGPSFAATVANEPIAWTASYIVVGGGSYFVAAQLNRDLRITDAMNSLATVGAIRGGLVGLALTYQGDADRHERAGAIFLGSITGTAVALAAGRGMTAGQAAAANFGANLFSGEALAASFIANPDANGKERLATVAALGLIGYPIGYFYAKQAPYSVTAGDVTTLWAAAGIGAAAGGGFIANGNPSAAMVAMMVGGGALAGVIVGDRLLVRPYDHTSGDGQLVVAGAVAGGLMGAGLGALSGAGAERDHITGATALLTALGGVGGVMWVEHYIGAHPDAGRRLGRLDLNTAGILAAAARQPGSYTIARWTF
jgi:hypothetical protein